MSQIVQRLFTPSQGKARQAASQRQQAQQTETQVIQGRQMQDAAAASAETQKQLGRASRTPRGRRLLVGDAGSLLG